MPERDSPDDAVGGWIPERPGPVAPEAVVLVDDLLPDAGWFWASLERFCVSGCCGLDAYDFSATSVAWACGWGTARPEAMDWRSDQPGDTAQLARHLRNAAATIRSLPTAAVSSGLLNDQLTPASCADLLDALARAAEPPRR